MVGLRLEDNLVTLKSEGKRAGRKCTTCTRNNRRFPATAAADDDNDHDNDGEGGDTAVMWLQVVVSCVISVGTLEGGCPCLLMPSYH